MLTSRTTSAGNMCKVSCKTCLANVRRAGIWSTNSRRDKCSSDLRTAKPKILIQQTPTVLEVTEQQHWEIEPAGVYREYSHHNHDLISYLLRATALNRCTVVITSSSKHPSNASSWNELCIRKPIAKAKRIWSYLVLCSEHVGYLSSVALSVLPRRR